MYRTRTTVGMTTLPSSSLSSAQDASAARALGVDRGGVAERVRAARGEVAGGGAGGKMGVPAKPGSGTGDQNHGETSSLELVGGLNQCQMECTYLQPFPTGQQLRLQHPEQRRQLFAGRA